MDGVRVFVPAAAQWDRTAPPAHLVGHTVTADLLAALDYTADQREDGEYAALVLASVVSLAQYGQRRVWSFLVDSDQIAAHDPDQAHNGEVALTDARAGQLTAWFDEDSAAQVSAAADQARGLDLDHAWDQPAVQMLLAEHALLWHAPSELSTLTDKEN